MQKTMKIEGMMCGHCEAKVRDTLNDLPEVETAVVSHENGTADITLAEPIADETLKAIVEDLGYKVLEVK